MRVITMITVVVMTMIMISVMMMVTMMIIVMKIMTTVNYIQTSSYSLKDITVEPRYRGRI